jgi:guanylate kinase
MQHTLKYNIDKLAKAYKVGVYWELIKQKNPANDKPYHNFWHLTCVTQYCYSIAQSLNMAEAETRKLIVAAMYHGFGHYTTNDHLNLIKAKYMFKVHCIHFNNLSSEYLSDFEVYRFTDDEIQDIQDIISATQYPYIIDAADLNIYQQIIQDADLLQWIEDTFIDHVVKGVAEELNIPLLDFLPKQKIFMHGFKYHTTYADAKHKEYIERRLYELDEFEKDLKSKMTHSRIVLVARAASGKDYLRLKFDNRGFKTSISYTTRPPRANEVNGVDYFFISDKEAQRMIELNLFYEYVPFNGWIYGTSKQSFYEDNVFIMTPTGVSHIKPEDRATTLIIFLDIDAVTRRDRLIKREMPGDSVDRRLAADEADFENFYNYDVRITNPNF